MTMTTTTIGAYTVDLELDGQPFCHIKRGSYHASLECLIGEGCLYDSHDAEHRVHDSVINEIEAWATAHGY